ncbi:MAG: UbiA family prenyltransferase [Chloroflexi bacterium]|nr:UbiA family prenyltransferase [Chloroflexota bacterium]
METKGKFQVPSAMSRADKGIALLKLARPRSWLLILPMFIFAYASTGELRYSYLALGTGIIALLTAATNLFNTWTDQAEDQINLPHRQVWIDNLGQDTLKWAIALGYLLLILMPPLVNRSFAIVIYLGIVLSIFYSWGPRLKARPVFSSLIFSTGVIIPFTAGWVINQPLAKIDPVFFLLTCFFLTAGGLRNLPDARGDQIAAVKNLFTIFPFTTALKLALGLLLSPYLLLAIFLSLDILPAKYLLCYLFLPFTFIIVTKALRDRTPEQKETTLTFTYSYQLLFLLGTLLIYYPTGITIVAALLLVILFAYTSLFKITSRRA